MHDTPVRMVAKGVLHGIVPWAQARHFLATRLRRRCAVTVYHLPFTGCCNGPLRMHVAWMERSSCVDFKCLTQCSAAC